VDARAGVGEVTRRVSIAAAQLVPLAVLFLMFWRAVNVPFLDEWSWAPLSVALHQGTLTWHLIVAQHNEHRNVVANLIFLAIDRAIGWNILAEQLVSFALLVIAQIAAWYLVCDTTPLQRRWPLFAVISLFLWSLAQWENFALGYNVGWNVCTAAAFAVLAVLAMQIDPSRVLLAAFAAMLATFASAQGALLWAIGLPLIVCNARYRVLGLIVWSALAAAVTAAFLRGYVPAHERGGLPGFAAVPYMLAVLGTPIGAWWGFSGSVAVGALAVIAFGVLAVRCRAGPRVLTVWSCAAFYAIANALLITLSRYSLGPDSALSSHYAAVALFLYVAVAGLAAAAWGSIARGPRWALIAAGVVIAYGMLDADLHGNRAWQLYTFARHEEVCALARHDNAALATLADADTAWVEREASSLAAVDDLPYRDALRACRAATRRRRRPFLRE
jgi:hypothetical protein